MLKFVMSKIKASQQPYNKMDEYFRKMAKKSGNKEILDFLNSWTDSGSDDSEEEN